MYSPLLSTMALNLNYSSSDQITSDIELFYRYQDELWNNGCDAEKLAAELKKQSYHFRSISLLHLGHSSECYMANIVLKTAGWDLLPFINIQEDLFMHTPLHCAVNAIIECFDENNTEELNIVFENIYLILKLWPDTTIKNFYKQTPRDILIQYQMKNIISNEYQHILNMLLNIIT
jgi:hypothetical protein